ncbi:MAG: hypothetical protein J7499_07090 [Sphingopyxis sp.]|nr:hypothetical protein [Sphingopyxis sp.]
MPTDLDDLLHRLASAPVDPRLAALTDAWLIVARRERRRSARLGGVGFLVATFAVVIGVASAAGPRGYDARAALNPLGSAAPLPLIAAVDGK